MPSLRDLNLQTTYHKGADDIATDFYLPCMACSTAFDRAVGFFSSTVYSIAWPRLKDFVERGGKMRIICSPVLSADDIDALETGYNLLSEEQNAEHLRDDIKRMLEDPQLHKPAQVLATLVSLGTIELKIAFMSKNSVAHRLFHDKVGVFRDSDGNTVVFKGSMNETWMGLSADGNLESVDVYVNWEEEREALRVREEVQYVEALWNNGFPGVTVRPFPEVVREELINSADPKNWPRLVDEICREIDEAVRLSPERKPGARALRPHQTLAIQNWLSNGRRGILEHATGSGKTFTALSMIRLGLQDHLSPLILVPSDMLLAQWHKEVVAVFDDLKPDLLLCGAGNAKWREGLLGPWTRQTGKPRIVISTMQTACSREFLGAVHQGQHLLLVADEVHGIGTPGRRKILDLDAGARLGLSATPRRAGDPEGTAAILSYFGGVIPPPFTLKDAIAAGVLVPYVYNVHGVSLLESEQIAWNALSAKIRQLAAWNSHKSSPESNVERLKYLLIQRAKILKAAQSKVPLACEVLRKHYNPGDRWIIYCDSQDQLYAVLGALREQSLPAGEYHSEMPGDRGMTLRHFESNGGILVSIRCLDQGIDIPSVSHALILASSKNPREFIQRRGRVLRKAPGKLIAYVHDAIVLPHSFDGLQNVDAILEGEMSRAIEFGRNALNPGSITDLERLASRSGLNWESLAQEGYEDDSED